jgi:hypothetical protein
MGRVGVGDGQRWRQGWAEVASGTGRGGDGDREPHAWFGRLGCSGGGPAFPMAAVGCCLCRPSAGLMLGGEGLHARTTRRCAPSFPLLPTPSVRTPSSAHPHLADPEGEVQRLVRRQVESGEWWCLTRIATRCIVVACGAATTSGTIAAGLQRPIVDLSVDVAGWR